MCLCDHLLSRIYRSQDIRHVGKGNQFWLLLQKLFIDVQAQQAIITHGDKLQVSTSALGQQLPGDEIAMVLHLGQNNQITSMNILCPPAIGHKIDALGGVACENDLLALACIDETSYLHTCLIHRYCRLFTYLIDSTMNVGIISLIVVVHC